MKKTIIKLALKYRYHFLCISLLCLAPIVHSKNQLQFFTISTGGITGVYYSAGNAICKLINQNFVEYKMRCAVESTPGSVFNVEAVRNDKAMFGLVQADVHYLALTGTGRGIFTEKKPYSDLRSVFSLHDGAFTIVAGANSGIKTLDDLAGKRVNIGEVNSGTRVSTKKLLELVGLSEKDFKSLTNLKIDQTTQALCDQTIDAYIFLVGHPSRNVQESTSRCNAKIIPLGDKVKKLLSSASYYSSASIAGGLYEGHDVDIKTISVRTTLLTDSSTPDRVVYNLVEAVMDNVDRFKDMHPALTKLVPQSMAREGLTAPLHPGAKKYYQENGL